MMASCFIGLSISIAIKTSEQVDASLMLDNRIVVFARCNHQG